LLRDFKLVLAELFNGAQQQLGEGARTNRLLFAIESALVHGFMSAPAAAATRGGLRGMLARIAPPAVPFDWVERLPACLPGTQRLIDRARTLGRTGMARLRLFIRMALNEGQLHECVRALCWDAAATARFFAPTAVVRDPVLQAQFVTRLETLAVVRFSLLTAEIAGELARPDYWRTVDLRPTASDYQAPLPLPLPTQTDATVSAGAPAVVVRQAKERVVHVEEVAPAAAQQPSEVAPAATQQPPEVPAIEPATTATAATVVTNKEEEDDPLKAAELAASQAEELEKERKALEAKLLMLGIALP